MANVTGTPTPTTGGQVSESGLAANAATGTFDGTATGTGTNVLTGQVLNLAAGWTAQAQTGSGTYGTFTVNANGTYSYTLTQRTQDGAGVETDSFSYTAKDANGNSVINTVTITIVDDVPVAAVDTGSVTEGALLTKTAAQGVLSNDKSGADGWESTGAVVGVVKGSNTSVDTQTGVNTAILGQYGTLTLQADGSYTYKANADAITSNVQDIFTYTVKDADGDLKSTTLTINVADVNQTPVVNDIEHSAPESSRTETKSNVVLTIDLSGSMDYSSGVPGKTRLDLVKEAVSELLNSGSVNAVFITTFSSSGYATNNNALNGGQWYTAAQLQQAILAVNALSANGGTNYDGALTSVMNYVNAAGAFPGGAGKNVSVFMSDGEPLNGAVGTTKETQWINWLNSKNFSDAYAIGFGGVTSTNANNLEPIAWKAGEVQGTNTTAAQDDHVILSDVTALKDALLQTVLSPGAVLTGDLKVEGGNTSGDGWNSTGGAVVGVVTFGAQSHTFTSATDTFTFDLGAVGKVIFKGDGTYTFTANNATDVNAALSAALTYTLKDVDGSVSNPAKLVFTLTDRSEVSATDDSNTGQASVTFSTQTNEGGTTPYAQSFNTNTNGAWAFNTSSGGNNRVVDQNRSIINAYNQDATLNGNGAKWLVTSYNDNTLDAQPRSSNSVLRLTDNNGNSNGDAQLITPQFTTTQAGQKFTFSLTSGNYSNTADTVSWALYKATTVGGVTTWAVVEQAVLNTSLTSNAQGTGTGNIQTGVLEQDATYRLVVTAHDGTSSGGNYYVNLDDFGLKNADTTSIVATSVANASGNVLANDLPGSEGASLYVGSTKVGAAGLDLVGSYGTLHLNADGSYTYTTKSPASGDSYHETQKDVFEYQLKQADGDTATANLVITVSASGEGVLPGSAPETPVTPTPLPGHEILASTGLDTLVGTAGDDLFTWHSGTQSASVDVVKGFGSAGNDKLVLGDLLQGEEHTSDLSKFLHFETQAGTAGTVNTVIKVSTSGSLAADGSGYNQQIVVEGVDLTGTSHDQNTMIKDLIDQGKLKLDHS
ncbi:Ig-like domain-containing protein [Comamonas sp. UBA7840]|uniref:Ig-like domain-containing protein n=1 Tax=Comamonas sp. UBA7840 TaxID=1946392 RepID=UPI00257EE73B|nr:type I secretion C-terminal target domain-containing protein [Comamonas sp. UBA7840]